ncbi:uncharacterized protein LOC132199494 [Neocloeon triangulifer]|uniref:uncharacterized protein LOC132199494 n=1 Tax=Neocloeon triangulifer TaxID=2078957 RepID=UPI00286F5B25|nr:uncharacterized protein LOC132199494 [Neocloeon triangulifer]
MILDKILESSLLFEQRHAGGPHDGMDTLQLEIMRADCRNSVSRRMILILMDALRVPFSITEDKDVLRERANALMIALSTNTSSRSTGFLLLRLPCLLWWRLSKVLDQPLDQEVMPSMWVQLMSKSSFPFVKCYF